MWQTAAILEIKKSQILTKCCGDAHFAYIYLKLVMKTANINGKTSQFITKCKSDWWVIAV